MIKNTRYTLCFCLLTCLLPISTSQAAAVYDVQAGQLVGIYNLDINGTAYDVSFRDGILENEFNLAQPFIFDAGQANDASLALSLAMLDVTEGNFDTQPTLTSGCAGDNCVIHTPYLYDFGYVSTAWFRNAAQELDDERGSADLSPLYDSTGQAVIYADWSVAAVPLPPALGLFIMGLALLGFKLKPRRP